MAAVNVNQVKRSLLVEYFERFSSGQKIVRALAIWLKLKSLLGKRTMQKDIKVEDRCQAETEIIKVIQQERLSLRSDIYLYARSISNSVDRTPLNLDMILTGETVTVLPPPGEFERGREDVSPGR